MSESVTVLALNSTENGLERFKLNATKALLVDGSAVTQPIDGTVAVSAVAGTVAVDGSAVTQPVSGAFYPATQPVSVASTLTVDGSGVTQPVSGSVSITGNVSTIGGSLTVANQSHFNSAPVASGSSIQSTGQDISSAHRLVIYGDTNNTNEEVGVQISFDNVSYYDLGLNLYPDSLTGNFVREIESSAKYIRINKENQSGSAETITADIMVKN